MGHSWGRFHTCGASRNFLPENHTLTPPDPQPSGIPQSARGAEGRGLRPRVGPAVLDLCGVFPLQMPGLPEHIEDAVSFPGRHP